MRTIMRMDRPFPTPVIHRIQTPFRRGKASDLWMGNIVQPVSQRATGKAN